MQKSLEETEKSFFRLVELVQQDYILASDLGVDSDLRIYYDGDSVGVEESLFREKLIQRGRVISKSKIKDIKGVWCVDILDCLTWDFCENKKELIEAYKAINKLRADTEFYLASVFVASKEEIKAVEKSFKSYRDACAKVFLNEDSLSD